jgi:hypothetical protein
MTAKTRGRKSLLNAKLEKQICGLLSDGVPIGATCDCVGISTRTYHGWIEKGEADPTSLYAHFMRATMRARGEARAVLVRKIKASDDWRAHSWLLSHCWPQEFSEARVHDDQQPIAPPVVNVIIREGEQTKEAQRLAGDVKPPGRE